MGKLIDVTGQRFGKRVVLGAAPPAKDRARWRFVCDCGYSATCLRQDLLRMGPCLMCGHKGPRPWQRKRPFEAQYNALVTRARHPVEITYEQFAGLSATKECHYCGAGIFWAEYRGADGRKSTASNLDRIDHTKPYRLDNVVICCLRCNFAKNTHFTYDEWKQLGALIRSWALGAPQSQAEGLRDSATQAWPSVAPRQRPRSRPPKDAARRSRGDLSTSPATNEAADLDYAGHSPPGCTVQPQSRHLENT